MIVSKKIDENEIINLISDDDSIPEPQKDVLKLPRKDVVKPKVNGFKKMVQKKPKIPAIASTSSVHRIIAQKIAINKPSPTENEPPPTGNIEHQPLAVIRVFPRALSTDLLVVYQKRIYVRLDHDVVNGVNHRYQLWPVKEDYVTVAGYFQARKDFFRSQSLFIQKINNCFDG